MHVERFLSEAVMLAQEMDANSIELMANELKELRERKGRLFLVGLGGSAANCSHAAADFRTLCELDAYSLPDSFAEFSARANDVSFPESFVRMLQARKLTSTDALMVMSVGGGTQKVSLPITQSLAYAKRINAKVFGIVGPNGGETEKHGTVIAKIPVESEHVTPLTEAFQALVWHALVSHPSLQRYPTKW